MRTPSPLRQMPLIQSQTLAGLDSEQLSVTGKSGF